MGSLAGVDQVSAAVAVHKLGVFEQLFRVLQSEPSSRGGTEAAFAVVAPEPAFGPQELLDPSVFPQTPVLRMIPIPRAGLVRAPFQPPAQVRPSYVCES